MSNTVPGKIAAILIGESDVMRALRERIARVAKTPMAVLIEGPTGAGKELVAQALHIASGRSGDCVAVNVCAVADGMFEDAFFGHARGAFTGAVSDHAGFLTEAHHGTIFLDEIGGLKLAGQAKLLRAIETRQFRPVGSRSDHTSDFRVVSASNTPLGRMTQAGSFRLDLAERLRAVRLEIPPLASRGGDALVLAAHFAERYRVQLSARAQRMVAEHCWPGNVRQLRNVIECAASYVDDGRVIDDVILRECFGSLDEAFGESRIEPRRTEPSFKDRRTLKVLEEVRGDVDAAAAALGIHRATMYRRLNRLRRDGASSEVATVAEVSPERLQHSQ